VIADVIEDDEHRLMSQTLRRLAEEFDGAALSTALTDFGYADLLGAQPREAVSTLFEALGSAGSMSAALQDVLVLPLRGLLDGETACHNVILPSVGARHAGSLLGDIVATRGLVIGGRPNAAYLVPVTADGQTAWVRVTEHDMLSTRLVAGLDPALAITEVFGDPIPATVVSTGQQATASWNDVVAAGRRALAHQIVGAVATMIDLAVAHARDRVQFGRPIGSFEGVRNRLADAYVAREAAAAAVEMAWEADDEFLAATLAKSLAGRAARIAAKQCQQVLAGVGFTAEHPFHRFLARALVLDSVLGSAAELPSAIGRYLVSIKTIPRLVEL
jgi:hypothetical protein